MVERESSHAIDDATVQPKNILMLTFMSLSEISNKIIMIHENISTFMLQEFTQKKWEKK